ncbi:apolipoprotein N-acyltransferase, partial [bacterium]|nr:apolipoprotein N-acyltransferase [bacterium]
TAGPRKRGLRAFGLAWIAGVAFWLINLKWLGSVTWPGTIVLSIYLALFFGIFGSFAATVANPWRRKFTPALTIPERFREMFRSLGYAALLGGFWCGLEWVRGIFLTGFGWNGLGVTFANHLILAQNAEYIGVIGLAFLPVFLSAVVVQTALRFYRQFMADEVKMLHWDFAGALLLLMLAFTVGTTRLTSVTNASKIEARVLLMQQNIPQVAGQIDPAWSPQRTLDGFIELTEAGLEQSEIAAGKALQETASESEVVTLQMPDLVVWPEACLHDYLTLEPDGRTEGGPIIESVFDYVTELGDFTFVTGINEVEGDDPMDPDAKIYNSFVADTAEGRRQSYQKHHLVILGEYIPDLPFLRDLYRDAAGVEFGSGITPGQSSEPMRLQIGDQEVGMIPSICFEDTVQRVTRKFVRDEPQLLVNITNDGWFGESEGAAQHFRNSVLRSIEIRRPMVRSANRGVTGVVSAAGALTDPYTRQVRSLVDENGSHFHRGYLLASVYIPAEGGITLYAAFGDWFAVTGLIVGLLWVIFRLLGRRIWKGSEE